MYWKMANSASLRVCHDLRQIISALMVLKLDGLEEGLDSGVVIAIALTAHRYLESVLAQKLLIIVGAVLAAAIRMMDAALGRLAERHGHL